MERLTKQLNDITYIDAASLFPDENGYSGKTADWLAALRARSRSSRHAPQS